MTADNPGYRERSGRRGKQAGSSQWPGFLFRMPPELQKQLDYEADRRLISRTLLMVRLIEIGLRHLPPLPDDDV